MSTLTWVLFGLVLYMLVFMWLDLRGHLPGYVNVQGPIMTLHTQRGKEFLDRLSRPRRFWRAWGNFGLGIAIVIMAASFLFLVASALAILRSPPPPSQVAQPRNVLVIPGVNDFLPLSVAPEIVFGLALGLVVHEGGHGLLCRVEDIDIDSMGLALFAFVPLGAFVEPDEESRERAERGGQTRMFAAGVTNNLAITILAFALLFGPVAGSIGVVDGATIGGVLPGSAAAEAGIEEGDVVVAVDGEPIESNDEFEAVLANATGEQVRMTKKNGEEKTVDRSLLVTRIIQGAPVPESLSVGDTITAVNGTPVAGERQLREELADRNVAIVETNRGNEVRIPIGAAVAVADDGPAAGAGMPTGETIVVTHVDGERVIDAEDLRRALSDTRSGETVTVDVRVDGGTETYDVTLGEHPREDSGFLGVTIFEGISGVSFSDFGAQTYPAHLYLGLLGGDSGGQLSDTVAQSFLGKLVIMVVLPVAGMANVAGLEYNFAGFTGGVENFYVLEGPLAVLGGLAFVLANVLYWTGWINMQLAFFNCIPAFPLDGGHILRTSTEAVLSRLPFDATRNHVHAITVSVGLTMLASLLLMIFGPQLLA